MAPRTDESEPRSSAGNRKIKKKSTGRIEKRPIRGYHTFKNGALNVKPKGGEIKKQVMG